jgi:Protein of unknown function (DUF4089)
MQRKPLRKSKRRRAKGTGKLRSRPLRRISGRHPDGIDWLVEACAQALGIPLERGWSEGVASNLRLILRHAKLVDEFPLADDIEPAPVFYA